MSELDLAFVDRTRDRRRAARLRRARDRYVPFPREQPRGRIEPDPARPWQVDLAPRVQVGEVDLGAARAVDRSDVGRELQQIARHEARREAELPQRLDEQPARIAARARRIGQGFLRRLHARLHPDQVADLALQPLVQRHQEVRGTGRRAVDARDELGETRRHRPLHAVGREFGRQLRRVVEWKLLGRRFEKEVERVVDGHFGDQIDAHLEFARLLGKHEPRLIVGERVLLPVDEVPRGFDAHRVRQDRRTTMRRGPQPHDLG